MQLAAGAGGGFASQNRKFVMQIIERAAPAVDTSVQSEGVRDELFICPISKIDDLSDREKEGSQLLNVCFCHTMTIFIKL